MFLRKLGFLAEHQSNKSLAQVGVAGSGFLWGGSLEGVAMVQASRYSHTQGAQKPAGEKVTA